MSLTEENMSKHTHLCRQKGIFFRIYPSEFVDSDYIKLDMVNNKIYIRHLEELSAKCTRKKSNYYEFSNDGIFMDAPQEAIYNKVNDGVLENVINGHNAVIMAFGQTGSGKTFTISGLLHTEEEFGILPRIIRDLFNLRIKEPENVKICVQISYVEFYNTYALDLLEDPPNKMDNRKCKNARKITVDTEIDASKCVFLAEGRKNFTKITKAYLSNSATSVVTFHVIRKSLDMTNPTKVYSRLHIVDLVGNDICATTSNITELHKQPKEIGLANITKLHLEQFALLLNKNPLEQKKMVNERMNVLIYYLTGDFSNQSFMRFLGHIKVPKGDLPITMSTLKFGNVLQGIHPKKHTIQSEINEEFKLTWLQNKLESIKNEQRLDSALLAQEWEKKIGVERKLHLNHMVDEYLEDRIDEISLINVTDPKAVFSRIRDICDNYKNGTAISKEENEITMAKMLSDTSIKTKSSKTSQTSSHKLLKKSSSGISKKNVAAHQKKTSGSHLEKKTSSAKVNDTQLPLVSKRRSSIQSSNSALRQSAHSKRKTSTSSVKINNSKCSVKSASESGSEKSLPMPNILPEKQELWKMFSLTPFYEETVEKYKLNQNDTDNSFDTYQEEIWRLRDFQDQVRVRKTDLILAQIMPGFMRKDEFDSEGNMLTTPEQLCKERVDEAEEDLLQQNDTVENAKNILDTYFENRKKIVDEIQEEFDKFCNENYQAPSPTPELEDVGISGIRAQSISDVILEEEPPKTTSEQEVRVASDVTRIIIPDLQKLMKNERKKKQILLATKKEEWKNF